MDNHSKRIRQQVESQYSELAGVERDSFANPESNSSYSDDDLAVLPDDAQGSSFGCGNPFAFSQIAPGQTVVDLGSGAGLDLLLARERTGPSGHVIGIDMTDAMIERARANIARAGYENVEVRKGIIEELPVETGSVDWVISNCVVSLSPDKERVFSEIARVLRPGGRMLISDIVVNDFKPWMRAIVRRFNESVAGAVSEDHYIHGLERAGLTGVKIVDRFVYDDTAIRGMVDSELNLESSSTIKKRVGHLLSRPLVRAGSGRVASIKVGARRALAEARG